MNRKWLGYVVAMCVALSSCDKKESIEQDGSIKFDGTINNLIATAGPLTVPSIWNTGDNIGIFMVDKGTSDAVGTNQNRKYEYNGNQFVPSIGGHELFYPVNDSKVNFIAYYPYSASRWLESPVNINVTNQANQTSLDILYARSNNGTIGFNKSEATTKVPLTFEHKLSKIIIKPIAGAGLVGSTNWNTMGITIKGMKISGVLDLGTGIVSSLGAVNDFSPFTNIAGESYQAIVIPQLFLGPGELRFSFVIDGDTYVWSNQDAQELLAGKETTYTITINKTGVQLNSVTITPWTSENRTGEAN